MNPHESSHIEVVKTTDKPDIFGMMGILFNPIEALKELTIETKDKK